MARKILFTTTGTADPVKLEELGKYFPHPTTDYDLLPEFHLDEIEYADSLQTAIDAGECYITDESGYTLTKLSYLTLGPPVVDIDNYSTTISYIGYGEITAATIQRLTITGDTGEYIVEWASGNKSYDKDWTIRYTYGYSGLT